MKRKRHSPEQVIQKLRDADAMLASGKTMGQVCQALEVSEQTFHRWRNQYGGMKAGEAKPLNALSTFCRRPENGQTWRRLIQIECRVWCPE
jgi:putative transposase